MKVFLPERFLCSTPRIFSKSWKGFFVPLSQRFVKVDDATCTIIINWPGYKLDIHNRMKK